MRQGLLTTCWGPSLWFTLHSIAFAYDPSTDKESYFNFFSNLGNILPCADCRSHYKQNLNRTELSSALSSQESMFRWVYDLHNKVNKQIGVPQKDWPSYESIKKKYESFSASCDHLPGTCGNSPNSTISTKRMKVVEQFGNVSEDQLPLMASTIVLAILLIISLGYIISLFRKRK